MAVQVVAVTTVGRFLVGDAHLAGGTQAAPVYPPGFIKSICGGPLCGDGHVLLGLRSGQFGTVTVAVSSAQSKAVTGLSSAAAYGTVTTKAVFTRTVSGLGSPQSFGTVVAKATFKATPSGLASAQSFGTFTLKTTVTRTLAGLGSAQLFGSLVAAIPVRPGGVSTAQAFGTPRSSIAFQIAGVDSTQAFGALAFKTSVKLTGLATASQFGKPWVGHLYLLSSDCLEFPLAESFCHQPGATILGTFLCNERTVAEPTFMFTPDCIESPDPAVCGFPICGDGTFCGGMPFLVEEVCISSPDITILNEFVCGQELVGGFAFITPEPAAFTLTLQPAECI